GARASALTYVGSKETFDKAPLLGSVFNLMTECRTVSVSIQSPPDRLYDYLADATRFPEWSAFISKIVPEGSAWRATTPLGTLQIEFVPRNPYRILDHTVTTADGTRVHVPMRVVPNNVDGS